MTSSLQDARGETSLISGDTNVHNSDDVDTITKSQKERIQRNKEKAITIRQSRRLQSKPYDVTAARTYSFPTNTSIASSRDTGGGFLLEDEDEILDERRCNPVEEDAPALLDEQMICIECRKMFAESFLFSKFRYSVCDNCRDPKEKHSLITKTEAKKKYLLQECDFGERGGEPLPFILKRNPHSTFGRDMYLYLTLQVEKRSYEVWGGKKELEAQHERKKDAREKKKEKKYTKEIQSLRKAVRASMPQKSSTPHEHSFSNETYSSETDMWTKTCLECGHSITYEKM